MRSLLFLLLLLLHPACTRAPSVRREGARSSRVSRDDPRSFHLSPRSAARDHARPIRTGDPPRASCFSLAFPSPSYLSSPASLSALLTRFRRRETTSTNSYRPPEPPISCALRTDHRAARLRRFRRGAAPRAARRARRPAATSRA